MHRGKLSVISICICAAIATLCVQSNAQITTAQRFSGQGTGIISVISSGGTSSTTVSGDTCPLPPRGGSATVTATGGPLIPGVLGSGTIVSSTSGSGITSSASSSVAGFFLNAGGYIITARDVSSSSQCNCCDIANPMCSAQSSVSGLTITSPTGANIPVPPSGDVTIPNVGTIRFNERTSAGTGDITVNGLHINLTVGGTTYDVIVARSHSDIVCSGIIITAGDVDISGHVLDQNGLPIARASVNITNSNGTVIRSTTSDDSGAYTLSGITSGQVYVVSASIRGFVFTPRSLNLQDEVTGFNLIGIPR
jgi:hypothetical protein